MMRKAICTFIFLTIFLLQFSCKGKVGLKKNNQVSATSSTMQISEVHSYSVPEGEFRGALWPGKEKPFFQIWVIDGSEESYHKLAAPHELNLEARELTDSWVTNKVEEKNDVIVYSVSEKRGRETIRVRLPRTERSYSFSVLKGKRDMLFVVFMNYSETVVDDGLFGYIAMKASGDREKKKQP